MRLNILCCIYDMTSPTNNLFNWYFLSLTPSVVCTCIFLYIVVVYTVLYYCSWKLIYIYIYTYMTLLRNICSISLGSHRNESFDCWCNMSFWDKVSQVSSSSQLKNTKTLSSRKGISEIHWKLQACYDSWMWMWLEMRYEGSDSGDKRG